MAGRRIAVVSDLHCNSIVAPWPADQPLEGGGRYEPNRPQAWLNRCWKQTLSEIGDVDVLVLNGDLLQGINARDGQLVSTNRHIEHEAALKLLQPLVRRTGSLYVIRGTEFHDGRTGESVELLARELGAVPNDAGCYSRWELYLGCLNGRVIHCQHSIGVAGVPTTEATVPYRDLINQLGELRRAFAGRAPNVRMIVRSHRHRAVHVDAPPELHAVVTPGFQLATAYVAKKGTVMQCHIGYVLIEDDGERFDVRLRTFPLPAPKVEGL